jgi:MFS family permease
VPGGILAAVQGSRRTAIYGITIFSTASLLCGLSSQLQQMEVLRFVVGLGMALFFGSSVTLITRYFGRGSEGLAIASLNSAHSVGGIIGIFGWIILTEVVGWRQSLLLSGSIGLISSIFLIACLPKKQHNENKDQEGQQTNKQTKGKRFRMDIQDIRKLLFDKSLFVFGLVLLGAQIAWGLSLTFIVFYLEDYLKVNSSTAGLIAGLGLISGVVSAPIFGKIYDNTKNVKKHLFVCGLAMSVGVAGIAIATTPSDIYIIGLSNVLIGTFSAGVFTIAYTSAKESYKKTRMAMRNEENIDTSMTGSYDTLAISWVNGLSLFGAFWVPVVFTFVVQHRGYTIAWLLGGIFSFLFILPALGVTTYKIKNNYQG